MWKDGSKDLTLTNLQSLCVRACVSMYVCVCLSYSAAKLWSEMDYFFLGLNLLCWCQKNSIFMITFII